MDNNSFLLRRKLYKKKIKKYVVGLTVSTFFLLTVKNLSDQGWTRIEDQFANILHELSFDLAMPEMRQNET